MSHAHSNQQDDLISVYKKMEKKGKIISECNSITCQSERGSLRDFKNPKNRWSISKTSVWQISTMAIAPVRFLILLN